MELYIDPIIKLAPINRGKPMSEAELKEIIRLYPDHTNKHIASRVRRTESSIKNIATRYRLRKTIQNSGQFRKGHRTWNKHAKGLSIGGKDTQFKKGHQPTNRKEVGFVKARYHKHDQRSYLYIKTANGFKLLHRHIWEQANGAIPDGMILVFRDGNTENCTMDNLEMISRAENVRRNHNREKASRSMAALWRRERIRERYGLKPVSGFGRVLKRKYERKMQTNGNHGL